MKAPKCYSCSGDKEVRHYSTQCPRAINTRPAINEERLTVAINTVAPAINTLAPSRVAAAAGPLGAVGQSFRAEEPDMGMREVPDARTPNRRQREDYNAYMRGYMARRRKG